MADPVPGPDSSQPPVPAPSVPPAPQTPPPSVPAPTAPASAAAAPISLPPPPPGGATPPPPPAVPPAPETKAKSEKIPLPLLSRAKLKQPREIPVSAGARLGPGKPKKRRLVFAVLARLLAYAILVGLGFGAVHFFRQTQVQGLIVTPDATLPSEVYLIRDFSDDIRTLRTEYRMSNEPFERDLRTKEESLRRVQGDLSGLQKRKELIAQDATRAEDEIKGILAANQVEAQQVWTREGGALDAEYAQKLADLKQLLLDRAKQTGVDLQIDPEALSPELWINSYRLALYNPPAKVKPVPEREWIEKQLADWHDYDKAFDDRRTVLKTKADTIRKGASPKIDEVQARITKDNGDIAETNTTAEPLKIEQETLQGEAAAARERAQAQRATFTDQLLQIPKRNVIEKFPLTAEGRFKWENLNQDTKYPPGEYLLWASIKKGDQEQWALVPFPVKENTRVELVVTAGAFVPAVELLK